MIKKIIAILIIILAAVGAGYLVYLRFFDPVAAIERMWSVMSEKEAVQISFSGTLGEDEVTGEFVLELDDSVSEAVFEQVLGPRVTDVSEEMFTLSTFTIDWPRHPITYVNNRLSQRYELLNEQFTVYLWIETETRYLVSAEVQGSFVDHSAEEVIVDLTLNFTEPQVQVTEEIEETVGSSGLPEAAEGTNNNVVEVETSEVEIEAWDLEALEGDRDGDGLSDTSEVFYGTYPDIPDTDGDGVLDGDEVDQGTNPLGSGSLFNFGLPE